MLEFNPSLKLVLADVDETIADVYTKATPAMIIALNSMLSDGKALFLVSGGGLQSIRERVVDLLKPELRHKVIVAHCSGAEVWGFQKGGEINSEPYYGVYEGHFTDDQKRTWRKITNQLIEKYHLKTYPTQPRQAFIEASQADPLSIMLADRGPQITFEFTNSINLTLEQKEEIEKLTGVVIPQTHGTYDLRYPIMEDARTLYAEANLPIQPHLGGIFALDHVIDGVDKTRAVKHVLDDVNILASLDLQRDDINDVNELEIWGDKFSQKKGGPDFQMCRAVSPQVRAIDFREKTDLPEGYNIQIWNGEKHLHEGLLEYLTSYYAN